MPASDQLAAAPRSGSASSARARRGALLAVAIALGASGCHEGGARERLAVAAVRQPATALFFVAREFGCFEDAGLEIDERVFDLGRDALALMRRGDADAAIAYETPVLRAAFVDERIRVLTMLHTSTRNTRLVVRRDRGLTDFADLRGRRMGVSPGTNAEYLADLSLRFGGIPREQVELVGLSPEAALRALVRGDLDAAVLFDPCAAQAEQLLGERGRVLQTELYTEVSLLVTRDDVLAARRPALRRLLVALVCAERVARARPEETLRRVRGRFPELGEAVLRNQLARVRWGLGLDHLLVSVLRDQGDWLRDSGAVTGPVPDSRRLLATGLLEEVAPESVTLRGKGDAPLTAAP